MNGLHGLRAFLREAQSGPVDCERELQGAWDSLTGADAGGMASSKLPERTSNLRWDPPMLTFEIERHGAIVAGDSGYAEIQSWQVDVEAGAAFLVTSRKKRIKPMAPRFEVEALADELADMIVHARRDHRLRWTNDGKRAQVRMGEVLPVAGKQTTEGRRKRLDRALEARLQPLGWVRGSAGWWTRSAV